MCRDIILFETNTELPVDKLPENVKFKRVKSLNLEYRYTYIIYDIEDCLNLHKDIEYCLKKSTQTLNARTEQALNAKTKEMSKDAIKLFRDAVLYRYAHTDEWHEAYLDEQTDLDTDEMLEILPQQMINLVWICNQIEFQDIVENLESKLESEEDVIINLDDVHFSVLSL